MRAILFLLTKGVRELHVNQIGNNFTALPKAVTFMHWWPNQIALIRSGAWILIPNEHTDQDTSDVSSKTDQDTDQET